MAKQVAIVKRDGATRKRVRFRPSAANYIKRNRGFSPPEQRDITEMQVKCESCGAMFFVPNVKKGKEVACRKCGAKIVAEPSKEAGSRLATTIRETSVNDVAAETYAKMAADSGRAKAVSEPGDKVVAWALRIYGALFCLGVVFGIVAMVGDGMDDWQGPAAVALIGLPIPALIPICSFAAFFNSRNRTRRLVRWLARSEGTPPSDIDNSSWSVEGWGAFYCVVGVLFLSAPLLGILGALSFAEESRNSYYGSALTRKMLVWQLSVCATVLFLGFKNLLLSALFRGQARFAREVAELLRKKEEKEAGPAPDAVKAAEPPASDPVR